MKTEQIYTNCLAEASYYIECDGEVAIVDPIRDVDVYINKAKENGAIIKYVLETHFHADFVSGHLELARQTGAKIVFGPGAKADFPIRNIEDNEKIALGKGYIRAIHTPGHTPESTCYILADEHGKEFCIFTGDTLFVGDVGRPDLLDGVIISKEEQAKNLYYTIQQKIKTLPDDMIVYPGHGPGSMCGKSIGKDTQSTIGKEKAGNYALQDMTLEEFAEVVLKGQLPAPKYFVPNALINRRGYDTLEEFFHQSAVALSAEQVHQRIQNGTLLLDTRPGDEFAKGHVPGSLDIGLDGSFAIWAGTLIDLSTPLIIVTTDGRENETLLRLARVGFQHVEGWLEGGITAWKNAGYPTEISVNCSPEQLKDIPSDSKVVDVRNQAEFEEAHLENAIHIPLRDLESRLRELHPDTTYYIHCAGGYRSVIAQSILQRDGFNHTVNVLGGFGAIKTTGISIVSEQTA